MTGTDCEGIECVAEGASVVGVGYLTQAIQTDQGSLPMLTAELPKTSMNFITPRPLVVVPSGKRTSGRPLCFAHFWTTLKGSALAVERSMGVCPTKPSMERRLMGSTGEGWEADAVLAEAGTMKMGSNLKGGNRSATG